MQNMTKLTDEQLVVAYANGNNKAFDVLLTRHQNRVFTYIMSFVKDEDVANDVFQDTFIKAVTTIRQGRYTENGKFRAWITRIAHNVVIDYFRQVKNAALVDRRSHDRASGQCRSPKAHPCSSRNSAARCPDALLSRYVVQGDSRGNRRQHKHRSGPHALCST